MNLGLVESCCVVMSFMNRPRAVEPAQRGFFYLRLRQNYFKDYPSWGARAILCFLLNAKYHLAPAKLDLYRWSSSFYLK